MTPQPILASHVPVILRNNARFVHWLSVLDADDLQTLLGHATYARQLLDGEAVLIAYAVNGPYRHKNVDWLAERFEQAFYIDRVIVGENAQGSGLGRILYGDVANFARSHGLTHLVCEVNTRPDNPASHRFHERAGFRPIGDEDYVSETGRSSSVRYYAKPL